MNSKLRNELWEFKQARKITSFDKAIFLGLTLAGVLSIFNLTEWWFQGEHISNLSTCRALKNASKTHF